jgi:hypothetical protein
MRESNLEAIVRLYESKNRPKLERLLESYRSLSTLHEAITKAAYALNEKGKRHRHQSRIKRDAVLSAHRALIAAENEIASAPDFRSLHSLIRRITLPIDGIGQLYVYDAALRIGAFRRLQPEEVFLHAGTARGATKLGLLDESSILAPAVFPPEFRQLSPHEIEDLLCIYKDSL